MAHLQNGFGLLPPNIATILVGRKAIDKPLIIYRDQSQPDLPKRHQT